MAGIGSELRLLYTACCCEYILYAYAVLSEMIAFVAGYTSMVDVLTTWFRTAYIAADTDTAVPLPSCRRAGVTV